MRSPKKFRRGYLQTNIIFEDSTEAVLIQNGKEIARTPVTDVDKLGKLLGLFFGYQRPEIDGFRCAIIQSAIDLPAVLKALRDRIDTAYATNKPFATAAREFLKTAKETINPSVEDADVREMLIQHILTEDIFAQIFGDSDFHHENNVAKSLYALEKLFFRGDVKPNFHSLTKKAHLDQGLSFLGTTPFEAGRGVLERPQSENRDTALIFGVQRSEMLSSAVKASIPSSSRSRPKALQKGSDF